MHWFSPEEVYGKTTQEVNVISIRICTKPVQKGTQNWYKSVHKTGQAESFNNLILSLKKLAGN